MNPISRILVVDDELTVRTIVGEMLAVLGYESYLALDGNDALAIFRQHRRELSAVLLDLTMPDQDGRVLYRQMREIGPDVPILIFSGYGKDYSRDLLQSEEEVDFLQKPFSFDDLSSLLDRVVRRSSSNHPL